MVVYSADAIATNEEVNVETVEFTLDADLKKVVASAKLYLDDVVVATASNSDVLSLGAVIASSETTTIQVTAAATAAGNATVSLNG
jgi:hypothetical protein